MRKIIFIETRPPDFHVFTRSPIPRLGTILLSTILNQHGYQAKTFVETIEDVDIEELLTADAVGLSTITSTSTRAYEIAKLLKKAGIPTFIGGPHVTYMAEEALGYCDYVLRGEADDNIVDFIRALEEGKGFEKIPGLSYRNEDGEIVHNKNVALCKDLNKLPIPDYSLVSGLEETLVKKFTITPIMTSRGCPYDCNFCSVTKMFGHRYRCTSKEKVIEELKSYHVEMGVKWIFFYDDNFTADKHRSKELFHSMIEKRLTPNWTAQVRVDIAKDQELLEVMKRAGCHTVYIGFESINPETLKAFNKRQSVDDIEWCIRTLHKNGIRIHGMFIFGADNDTVDTIHETVRFAKKNNLESVQFLMLTPLPGTNLFREFEKEGRIVNRDWALYDAHHVVFEPRNMSYYELQTETMRATKEFYSIPQIIKRAARFDLFNVAIKTYGWKLTRTWYEKSEYFLKYLNELSNAGRAIEIAAKKTAEDIQEKFRQLELSGHFISPHNKPRGSF